MTLLQRAISTGVKLVWDGVTKSFEMGGTGYDVTNQKGSFGNSNFVGGLLQNLYQYTVNNIKNNLKSIISFYAEDLATQLLRSDMYSILNSIEWADTRLWEVRMEGLPKPFTAITPVDNTTLNVISVNVGTMNIGNTCWQYLESQGTRNITMEFLDDVTGTMEEYLYAWMDEITGQKCYGITPIEKAGKVIKFRKLSRSKFVTSQLDLYCVPNGSLRYDNNQDSTRPRTISMDFAVLGIQRRKAPPVSPSRDMSLVTAIATRNLARRNKYVYKAQDIIASTINSLLP